MVSRSAYMFIVLLIVAAAFCGCEGMSCARGVVEDKATGQPLDSVQLKVLTNDNLIKYSNSNGKYDACNRFGGCTPRCGDIMVEFSKKGYKTITTGNDNSNGVVYMEKQ